MLRRRRSSIRCIRGGKEKKNHNKKKFEKGNRVGCKTAILILWYFDKCFSGQFHFIYLFIFCKAKWMKWGSVVLHSQVEMWQHNKCR